MEWAHQRGGPAWFGTRNRVRPDRDLHRGWAARAHLPNQNGADQIGPDDGRAHRGISSAAAESLDFQLLGSLPGSPPFYANLCELGELDKSSR